MNNEELLEKMTERMSEKIHNQMDITKEELLEKIQEKIDITKEEIFQRMDDKMEENNKTLFQRMDDKMEKNNEKLWKKMQQQMKKDKEELKDQMNAMQKENLEFQKGIQEQMHIVKDVNLPCILEQVTKTRKELKETENKLSGKLDQYIEEHAVEHKKIDYELANIKWKTKVAN